MSIQDHLPLAPRDLLILATLAEEPAHGYGIIKEVEARSDAGVLLDPANLYRVLRRMRQLGWIQETPSIPDEAGTLPGAREGADGGGSGPDSRRRTYEITSEGKRLLLAELTRLERLLRQVRPALAEGDGR
jgi:hypothetical protein